MYQYDIIDDEMLADRTAEFREQCERRLAGRITEEQFKPLRLKNGLYLQLHAYMLRIAIPYGTLNSAQMRMLAHVARTYDRGYGHFTTRTNLQLHWIKLRDAADILADLAKVGLHAIQTSGNCIRNLTADPHAGATADEVDDPRVWAEAIRQWSTFHPEFSYLPRKFKIAVTGSATDRAAIQVYDVGLRLLRGEDGALNFKVLVGGGLGRSPYLGQVIREALPARHLLSYLQAIIRVYNRTSRRDNIHKQRIKVLVATLGAEEFGRQVEAEWNDSDKAAVDLPDVELARIRGRLRAARFRDPAGPFGRVRGRQGRQPRLRPLRAQQRQAAQAGGLRHRRRLAEGRSARRRATARPTRWTSSPISPSAILWTRSASPMSRT